MDDMIERVARASFLYWRENATRKGFHLDRPQTFDEMQPDEREFALGHARAIIAALREPTEEMLAAGIDRLCQEDMPETCAGEAYQAMIDVILSKRG